MDRKRNKGREKERERDSDTESASRLASSRVCYRRRDAIRSIQATRLGSKPGHQPLSAYHPSPYSTTTSATADGERYLPRSLEFAHRPTGATTSSSSSPLSGKIWIQNAVAQRAMTSGLLLKMLSITIIERFFSSFFFL